MSGETFFREPPDVHDEFAGQPAAEAGQRSLPTPSTPGYTYFTDYLGNRWTCCVCVKEFLTYAQKVAIKRGLLKQGFDIWQLTGGATASAGTHSQGGAFDLLYQTGKPWAEFFRDFGATGTWPRYVSQGFTKDHLHGVLNGCPHNAPALYQVTEQRVGPPTGGGDGLTGTAPDYVRDPNPYRTWDAGVYAMKKELGLLALDTTTTLSISPISFSKGAYAKTSARTSQSGTTFVEGYHIYEYQPAGTTTWQAFHQETVVKGYSEFFWNYGSSQRVRVRFSPKDATKSKSGSSAAAVPNPVDMAALQAQNASLKNQVATLTKENTDLKAQIAAGNPPEPVPAFGADVSGWQTPEQVRALAADPKNSFLIVKATQGLHYVSNGWPGHKDIAIAANKYAGAYGYGEMGNDGVEEANHFLATVGSSGHTLAYDLEDQVTPAQVINFLDTVAKARPDAVVCVYTNWFWILDNPKTGRIGFRNACTLEQWEYLVDHYDCWLADVAAAGNYSHIDPKPGSTKGWRVIIHQYSYAADSFGEAIDRDWTPDLKHIMG